MEIRFEVRSAEALRAFDQAPAVMERSLERFLKTASNEVARSAKDKAPTLYGHLVNSIRADHIGKMHWRVSPGERYSEFVELGTKPGYFPPMLAMIEYVKTKSSRAGVARAKPGSQKRQSQDVEFRDRAFGLARFIHAHGTKPHPYMAPAAEEKRSRVFDLLNQGVDEGLREVFGR